MPATPEPESDAAKGIDTSVRCQSAPFGSGSGLPKTTVGGVVSILMTTDCDAVKPAPFVAVHVSVVPVVSLIKVAGAHPADDAMPDSGSARIHVTVTPSRCHPAALGGDDSAGAIDGADASAGGA